LQFAAARWAMNKDQREAVCGEARDRIRFAIGTGTDCLEQ